MRPTIPFIAIVQIAVFAAWVPAPPLPSSLHTIRHKLHEISNINPHSDDDTTGSYSWGGDSDDRQASIPEMNQPVEDGQTYADCAPQPEGLGPRPEQVISKTHPNFFILLTSLREDTPAAFRYFEEFYLASTSAPKPEGYELAVQGLGGAMKNDLGFLGSHLLEQYDTEECARFCDDLPTCASFNVYFERDPTYEPNTTAGCPNPPSTTNINCVLWNSRLNPDAAINFGEIREDFQVVITGSNLYNKIKGPLDLSDMGFSGPRTDVDNDAAFEVPDEPTGDYSTLLKQLPMYYRSYDDSATFDQYDPTLCAHLCSDITNEATPSFPFTNNAFPVCSMFVAYELRYKFPIAMVCELYSSVWSSRYQTLRQVIAFSGEGDETITLQPTKISVYQRNDYQYPPICAMDDHCGTDYYAGGDCSGWGQGYC